MPVYPEIDTVLSSVLSTFPTAEREAKAEEIRKHVFEGAALPTGFSAENVIKINTFKTFIDAKSAEEKTALNETFKEHVDDFLYFGNGSDLNNNNSNNSSHTSNESLGPNWEGSYNTNNDPAMNMRPRLPPGLGGRPRKTRKARKARKTRKMKGGKRGKTSRRSRRV
jgi:hypothetical protein